MTGKKQISDEFLNAFVDNQIGPGEKSRAYPLISQDEDLNRRVCEIRKIRDMIQLAYETPPMPAPIPRGTKTGGRGRKFATGGWGRNVAAGVLLAVGVLLGWMLRDPGLGNEGNPLGGDNQTASQARLDATHTAGTALQRVQAQARHDVKLILHLNRGNNESMRAVLDEAENVLRFYEQSGQTARVEIVTNGEGLDLLRADKSPYAVRISEMRKRHKNLVFAACQNTIERLQREQGVQAQLVPEAIVIDSGVAQIILLQQQGWAYIQV